MKKKVLQILLPLLILTAMVAGCGKKEAAVEPTEIVSEATEATATEETETSTEEKQTDASKETNTTTKETANASESTTTAAAQAQETPQAEVTPPAETNSQPVEQTQIVTTGVTGREFTVQGSTGTTFLGTTYPIVSEFNKLGLNPNYNDFFSSDGMTTDFAKAMGQANRAISDVLGYPSDFVAISATSAYINCLDAHISRMPESGYYVWVYAADITDTTDGGTSSRALHQVILGAITSTPAEVEAALFEAMWGDDPYNIGSCQWVTVGDCKILYAYGNPNEGEWRYEFAIKPAN